MATIDTTSTPRIPSGLTRDGTFLIENGKITKALKNFRWNESPLFMPALRVKEFNFTSLSDAV